MKSIVLLYLVLAIYSKSVLCIPSGQKMSILRAPFIVCLEGTGFDNNRHPFGGVILDEKLVLTTHTLVRTYFDVVVKVGIGDRTQDAMTYRVRRAEHNNISALVEIFRGTFDFGLTVQRAILPKYGHDKIPFKTMLYAASYGSTNLDYMSGDDQHLHGRPYYVTYSGLSEEFSKSLFLISTKDHGSTKMTNGDMGAPLWDLDTGEVAGLAGGYHKGYVAVISLASQRQWIDKMRIQMHLD